MKKLVLILGLLVGCSSSPKVEPITLERMVTASEFEKRITELENEILNLHQTRWSNRGSHDGVDWEKERLENRIRVIDDTFSRDIQELYRHIRILNEHNINTARILEDQNTLLKKLVPPIEAEAQDEK